MHGREPGTSTSMTTPETPRELLLERHPGAPIPTESKPAPVLLSDDPVRASGATALLSDGALQPARSDRPQWVRP